MPFITYMKSVSIFSKVDDSNITLNSQRTIYNYTIDTFGERSILFEESVHNFGTGYMAAEY